MAATEINARWQAEMSKLFAGDGNPDDGFSYVPEVFNLNDQLRAAGLPVDPQPTTNPETPTRSRKIDAC
jgi:L-rhamnose mutarotase